jgi:alpha-glucuronidase
MDAGPSTIAMALVARFFVHRHIFTGHNRAKRKLNLTIPFEDGYELWLRYRPVSDLSRLDEYRAAIGGVSVLDAGPTSGIIRTELERALPVLLGNPVPFAPFHPAAKALAVGTVRQLQSAGAAAPRTDAQSLGEEGFLIHSGPTGGIVITGNSDLALLYGVFHFLRLLQTQQAIRSADIASTPRFRRRILAHWDNLDGTVERGYAGRSLWRWDELPEILDPRYRDYARACASIGINGAILNNVNTQIEILDSKFLAKAAALADCFRPYGVRVYLSAPFSAPLQLGGLSTSDPRDPAVARWWREKADEIYRLIPDFGGFQIKANSEGQSGPRDYGAQHDEGANLLARALEPHGGVVLWRAFVYDPTLDPDRAKCAYQEFVPLDGRFDRNAFVQVKNGPIDFQPREPFHPIFGAMERTALALELQITQEYLGQSVHLVYLAGMWKEILDSDTFAAGPGSTVAGVVNGSVFGRDDSCILGVANTGSDRNWCGHHFAQANWYAFGRLAWDHTMSAAAIADEWIRATWSNDPFALETIRTMMLGSWPACVDTMAPLGLHHLMREGHHYGPDPAFRNAPREDWNNVYYHRADAAGVGFDRSRTGSNAVGQYRPPLHGRFDSLETCPEKYLLWFHHVGWDHRLQSGRTLWEELQHCYNSGVEFSETMRALWDNLQPHIDPGRFDHVGRRLAAQWENARLWREVCLKYFARFARPGDS